MKYQNKQINLKIDGHLYEKLKEYAKDEGKSVQYILTESLFSMMARKQEPVHIANTNSSLSIL